MITPAMMKRRRTRTSATHKNDIGGVIVLWSRRLIVYILLLQIAIFQYLIDHFLPPSEQHHHDIIQWGEEVEEEGVVGVIVATNEDVKQAAGLSSSSPELNINKLPQNARMRELQGKETTTSEVKKKQPTQRVAEQKVSNLATSIEQQKSPTTKTTKMTKTTNNVTNTNAKETTSEIKNKTRRVMVEQKVSHDTTTTTTTTTTDDNRNHIITASSKNTIILVHLHIGKCGGTSLDPVARSIAQEIHAQSFIGFQHFDWTRVDQLKKASKKGTTNTDIDVIMFLRHPVARSISHFHFAQTLPWTRDFPAFRKETVDEFLHDPRTMIQIRDVWQDGVASVAWLTGTHYANWVTPGLSQEQIRQRELAQTNYTRMMQLAADRLEETKWFGILEDTPRSLELLQYTFNLSSVPVLRQSNKARTEHEAPSAWALQALESLMPQDHWLYNYGLILFEARWTAYQTGQPLVLPKRPPLPNITCSSTRFHVECASGPLAGLNYTMDPSAFYD